MTAKIILLCSLSGFCLASDHHQDLGKKLSAAVYRDQGKRDEQEDAYHIGEKLFVICDGHVGSAVAESAIKKFPDALKNHWKVSATKEEAFKKAFGDVEKEIFEEQAQLMRATGSTLVAAYIGKKKIDFAWVGDSRALYWGSEREPIATRDHTPESECERERITKANGIIYREVEEKDESAGPWRINGSVPTRKIGGFVCKGRFPGIGLLCPKRAGTRLELFHHPTDHFAPFVINGDLTLEPQHGQVIADPDYIQVARNGKSRFVVIASDGLWDVMTNKRAMDYVEELAEEGRSVHEMAKDLVSIALARGSEDNITAIVIDLR